LFWFIYFSLVSFISIFYFCAIYYCVHVSQRCHYGIILNSSVVSLLWYVCCVIMCCVCFEFVYHGNVVYFLRFKFSGMFGCQLVHIWLFVEECNASFSRVKLSNKCSPWSAWTWRGGIILLKNISNWSVVNTV
jgi:hypothetical protein